MTPQLSFPRRRRYEDADAANPCRTDGVLELHYSVKQIAAFVGLCENAVRGIFRNEPALFASTGGSHEPSARTQLSESPAALWSPSVAVWMSSHERWRVATIGRPRMPEWQRSERPNRPSL